MKSMLKALVLALCFGSMNEISLAQADRSFITHQSGDWSDGNTWEEFIPNFGWIYPATQIPNSAHGAIRIGINHTVTLRNFDVIADQLTVDGRLNVNSGRVLTIADGPGVDLATNLNNATVWIDGTLVNNGFIQINLGALKIGTLVNNGNIEIGGVFQADQGTITGNDLRYGVTGSTVINLLPGYIIDNDNHIWPSDNGPTNVTIIGTARLNGDRTVNGSLKIIGTLHVVGTLTNRGTAEVNGTLQVTGTYMNNGITQILGTFQINKGGIASGNNFVYIGTFNKLVFNGSDRIDGGIPFWPSTNGPATITVPDTVNVTLNAALTASGSLEVSGTLQVADTLTTNGTTQILPTGTTHIAGVLINNGTIQVNGAVDIAGTLTNNATIKVNERLYVAGVLVNIGTMQITRTLQITGLLTNNGTTQIYGKCQVAGTLTNTGAMQIEGTFQLDQGGAANGNDFAYGVLLGGTNGTLVFNNSSGSYDVNNGSVYWPIINGPAYVIVQGAGGIMLSGPRTMNGFFQVGASVTNASNLTLSGIVQINAGAFFDSSPIYTDEATLVYDTGGSYEVGAEWGSGTHVGSGVPMNVEINQGSTVKMPGSSRTCPGDLTIRGTLVLSTTAGADLGVGGNWQTDRYIPGMLISNLRTVRFNGASEQIISGVTKFDYLTINNPAGVSVPGYDDTEVQAIDSVTVSQTLTFAAGNIRLGQLWQSVLILAGSVSGASANRHIVTYGESRVLHSIAGGGSFQFPIGPTETSYNPLTIALDPADSTETFSVHVDSTVNPGVPDDSFCVQRTWEIGEATAGGNHAALTFQWAGTEEGEKFTRNASSTYLYDGDYVEAAQNGVASGTDPYMVSTTGAFPCTWFSSYIVGKSGGLTTVEESSNGIPTSFKLNQNYPNPFNPSTTIRYAIPKAVFVDLRIYNILGNEAETLVDEKQQAGKYEVQWNPAGLPSGIYFCRLKAGEFTATRRLVLLQ